jgi:hypothetical protein
MSDDADVAVVRAARGQALEGYVKRCRALLSIQNEGYVIIVPDRRDVQIDRLSGNPAGKPKGARHRTTLLAERLMQDDVKEIVNAVLAAARNGDMMAAKIILEP